VARKVPLKDENKEYLKIQKKRESLDFSRKLPNAYT
jgi:hypothetical protein